MPVDPLRKQLLRRVWLFSDLEDADLERIAALGRERACTSGEVLVRQGEASADLFAVIAGRLKVTSVATEGAEVLLSVLGSGDVFGELALLDGEPRSATVMAAEHCRLLVVPRAAFRPLLLEVPVLGVKLLQVMTRHVRRLSARTEDGETLDVRARLAKTLLDLAARFGIPAPGNGTRITLRLSQQELGRLVGATREMINKCLREWGRRRIVQHGRGLLTVMNDGLLQEIAESSSQHERARVGARSDRRGSRRRATGSKAKASGTAAAP